LSAAASRLIGIDLDGTIEDSRADMVAAARRVRAAFDLPGRSDAALLPHVNGGMPQLYRACFDDFLARGPDAYERVRAAYEQDYLSHVADETRLYPGMADALGALRELGTLACITNKPERIARALLDALGVGAFFMTVVGGDTGPEIKPHPSLMQAAAERCKLTVGTKDAFMIGDTRADVEMARAFGARSVWCAWGYVPGLADEADFAAQTPGELAEIIRRAQ
jgi:phosphoglycolate phosphatase